jgi:hypothetical protein
LEWTLKQWQDHVTQMEKRMNELEREVYQIKQSQTEPFNQVRPPTARELYEKAIREYNGHETAHASRLGEAWTA